MTAQANSCAAFYIKTLTPSAYNSDTCLNKVGIHLERSQNASQLRFFCKDPLLRKYFKIPIDNFFARVILYISYIYTFHFYSGHFKSTVTR